MRIRTILIVVLLFSTSMAVAGDPKWKELRQRKIERNRAHSGKIVPDPQQHDALLAWERQIAERKERARERAAREREIHTYADDLIDPAPQEALLVEQEEYDPEAWMYDPIFLAAFDPGFSTL